MNIFKTVRAQIIDLIHALMQKGVLPVGLDAERIACDPPREAAHGDMATNAAMILAKPAGLKPIDLAKMLVESIKALPLVQSVEIAGPGFINIRLHDAVWRDSLADIVSTGRSYGSSDLGQGRKVNLEYVSANPTGPMHVGHGRGAVFGDALARLLDKVGFDVTKEYYINDAGAQVDVLARSAYLRYREALGEDIGAIPEGLYPGDYLKSVGQDLAHRYGKDWLNKGEQEWLPVIRAFAIDAMMALIKDDLKALGVEHDVFSSERHLVEAGKVEDALAFLAERDLVYTDILEPPKGKMPEDWEPRPQVLFRASQFGDDVDRPLKKSDGSWTYFASDVAYHLDKYRRGFADMIDMWGADHGGYVKRMQAAVRALTEEKGHLDVKLCQMVNLLKNGEPVKMSKRAGTFVTLREVVDEVGAGVVRFIMLTRKNDAPLDFDLAKVLEQSRDNPVFYVQYAHARVHSVMRHAKEMLAHTDLSDQALAQVDLSRLDDADEIGLIKNLANWPRTLESAAVAHEPHRLAFYLYDLAAAFHGLWNKGKDNAALRFLQADDHAASLARLALIRGVAIVIASGLDIFGVEPVEEMR